MSETSRRCFAYFCLGVSVQRWMEVTVLLERSENAEAKTKVAHGDLGGMSKTRVLPI